MTQNLQQRSKAWFSSRRGKLTGSNAGAALGLSPWKTPEDLLREMVRSYHGAAPEFESNPVVEYGRMHEPLALMDYLGETGNFVLECGFFVHPEHDWLGASPDGLINDDGLAEVKCPYGLRDKKGPDLIFKSIHDQPHYYVQIQVEMACSGRNWCHFYQWSKHGHSLERVELDKPWWNENLPKLREFYDRYLSEIDNPAHLEPKQVEINTQRSMALLMEWDKLSFEIDQAEARKKEIMAELTEMTGERDALIHGRKLSRIERKGSVQYKNILELQGVDLEQYRGEPSVYWRLS